MNNIKKNRLTNSFFFALFFVSLRIGEIPHRIPSFIYFILSFVIYVFSNKSASKIYYQLFLLAIFLAAQFSISLLFQSNDFVENSLLVKCFWFFQYLGLLMIVLFFGLVIDKDVLLHGYLKMGKIALFFVYVSFILTLIFNYGIGSDVWSNGWIRPHGFFSEPSNLVYILPGFLMYGILNKKKIFSWVIIGTIFLSLSPTVYGVTLIVLFFYLLTIVNKFQRIAILIASIFLLLGFIIYGYTIYSNFDSSNALSFSIQRLIGGVLKVTNSDDSLSNSRADLAFVWFDFIKQNPFAFYIGFGLGVSNAYTDYYNNGMTLDSSIIIMLINSFGLIITMLIIVLIGYSIYKSSDNKLYQWIFLSIVVGQIFNPSGVYYQYFVFLLMTVALNTKSKIYQ